MTGPEVVVAVATYQRPELLTSLLPQLVEQAEALRYDTRVVVVDNDPARSAEATVAGFDGAEYFSEPRPGIAAARNRALEAAHADDVLVFIDDDELPTPGWLDALVSAWEEWGCTAVAGPVVSSFEAPVDAWVAACSTFKRPRRSSGTLLAGAATNNLLLDLAQLRASGLRFDDRFGLTGGSDTMLTQSLVSRGGEIRWCDEAVMTEVVPTARATRTWALARSRRTGNVWSRVKLELAPTHAARQRARARLLAVAVHRMVIGLMVALRGRITGDMERLVAGELDVAQGRGVFGGAWGGVVTEYVRDSSTSKGTDVPISSHEELGKILIAVLTYKRNDDLVELLPLLVEQLGGRPGEVLVVDNDPEGSAAPTVTELDLPEVRYVHESQPGIAHARNRALDEAGDAHVLVFIDDDERPDPAWLTSLLDCYQREQCVAVAGAVIPDVGRIDDPWIVAGGFFVRQRHSTGSELEAASTANLLIDLRRLEALGSVRFDVRFGLSGGSDTMFSRELIARGGRIVWCDEAVVTDYIRTTRVSRAWVLQRHFRSGNSWARTSVELSSGPATLLTRLRLTFVGVARIVVGTARSTLGTVVRSPRHQARGSRTAARGTGMTLGAWGRVYVEYRRKGHDTA